MSVKVALVMGSKSDWSTMKEAAQVMDDLGVAYHVEVISAHRTPDRLMQFAADAVSNAFEVIIAGAGGAAHLPGMLASKTRLPVLGVPIQSKALNGVDSLYSIVQMPRGVAVGSLAIGGAGAFNSGLLACQILANFDADLAVRIDRFREQQSQGVLNSPDPRHTSL